ncbi:MAG: excinuclease ABC subunit UvrC [Pseudochelatococcus sp.]|jgi:excinuclease ABC subunit C|uniref:excinuclease ABC subunit UvrC n=1 Tax=Pseudochelatococcus sp. TaxID=2020869 RepID=UPI003D93E7BF
MMQSDDPPSGNAAPEDAEDNDTEELADTDLWADDASTPPSLRAGAQVIRRFWKTLPHLPGVYRMIDANGEVLYVGKALDLKKRVASYVRGIGHGGHRTMRMIAQTAAMEFITTETETAALLLEANLIKQLRPRYNVLMRDDKSFPYILLTGDHPAPQLVKHRGARVRKGRYFGPFADGGAVNRTVNAMQRAFLLRTCTDSYYENRTRPCLLFQIKRCAGPCTGEISLADYATLVGEAADFLSGRSTAVKRRLAQEMQEAAEALEFERAARYRDRLAALSTVQGTQSINPQTVDAADVFAIAAEAGLFCIQVFFFRNGQNWGNRSYFPHADRDLPLEDVLSAFLAQFYADKPCPRLVLLSHRPSDHDLLEGALSAGAGHAVELAVPRRGEKRTLVAHVAHNAQEALARRLADTASQDKLLGAVAQAFGLPHAPRRIEVYDNSHISGTNAVGAMIVAGREGFMKTHYRTFNIRSQELTPGDDFGMMKEVLHRRFSRLVKEAPRPDPTAEPAVETDAEEGDAPFPASFPAWPDLLLIDGGQGQVAAVRAVLADIGVTCVPVVGVAKGVDRDAGRETFFVEGRAPFRLPPRDPTLYYVERLRDEAHRFAIGTHRAKRKREFTKSPLDEIPGVGPARKRALLLHFGTAKAVSQASLEDLRGAPGINAATAKMVYGFFHERDG